MAKSKDGCRETNAGRGKRLVERLNIKGERPLAVDHYLNALFKWPCCLNDGPADAIVQKLA